METVLEAEAVVEKRIEQKAARKIIVPPVGTRGKNRDTVLHNNKSAIKRVIWQGIKEEGGKSNRKPFAVYISILLLSLGRTVRRSDRSSFKTSRAK